MLDTLSGRNTIRVEPQDERKKFKLRLGSASRFCHAQVPCKLPCKCLAVKGGCAKGSQWDGREIGRKHENILVQLLTTKTALQSAMQLPCTHLAREPCPEVTTWAATWHMSSGYVTIVCVAMRLHMCSHSVAAMHLGRHFVRHFWISLNSFTPHLHVYMRYFASTNSIQSKFS